MAVPMQFFDNADTLRRIYEVANEDVEMRDAFPGGRLHVVLDTNILMHHFNVVKGFSEDVERLALPVLIIIPNVVLSELDGLKKREQFWFTRTFSTWILGKVKERRSVKMQAREETCHIAPVDPARANDLAIYDCCMYFYRKSRVVLLSGDKNLCIECEKDYIPTISPPREQWSSRELAQTLFPDTIDPSAFQGRETRHEYRPSRSRGARGVTVAPLLESDDMMDIDDEDAYMADAPEQFEPKHALDALHLQAIEHFTATLKAVALRVRTAAGELAPVQSAHAPAYRRKAFELWVIGDCLAYLDTKKPWRKMSPSLQVFFLRRNEDRGWRRGQDWSRQDWMNVLDALVDLGTQFEDGAVVGSAGDLKQEVERLFMTRMRPTGT
ncbi:PIN domain-containing protein [Amylocystis lapponica]|nr:PIN domain-containing protein [Amylocystis lapponica]